MTIPNKELEKYSLSQWVELALDDIIKTQRNSEYHINMSQWHKPNDSCSVCFAGSVMAMTLGANIKKRVEPGYYPVKIENALLALDQIRQGAVIDAIQIFGYHRGLSDLDVQNYADDKTKWRRDMRKIIKMLKAVGL